MMVRIKHLIIPRVVTLVETSSLYSVMFFLDRNGTKRRTSDSRTEDFGNKVGLYKNMYSSV